VKKTLKMQQNSFLSNLIVTFTVEKVAQNFGHFCSFKKTAKSKQTIVEKANNNPIWSPWPTDTTTFVPSRQI
jgi:hypothetical protein